MHMLYFWRKVVLAAFVLFFIELKKFKLKLIRELNFDWIMKTNLWNKLIVEIFYNRFIMRCFFDELLSDTLWINEFFQFMIVNVQVAVIVRDVNANAVNNLKNLIYYLNWSNVCWLVIDEIKDKIFIKYFCICVCVIFLCCMLNIVFLIIFISNASVICEKYLRQNFFITNKYDWFWTLSYSEFFCIYYASWIWISMTLIIFFECSN